MRKLKKVPQKKPTKKQKQRAKREEARAARYDTAVHEIELKLTSEMVSFYRELAKRDG